MVIIENENLKVTLSSKGAELVSLIDKITETEYIWQGNEHIWPFHAPNLFPIVGGLNNDTLIVDGNQYGMKRHGFTRHRTFRRIESSPVHAQFALRYDQETLVQYPYKFEFQVVFHLTERSLKVMYKVINLDEKRIYFSVGGHPAFNVPMGEANGNYEDYYIQFDQQEELYTSCSAANGLLNGEEQKVLSGDKIYLTKNIFDADALIFKDLKSKRVTLKSDSSTKKVQFDFPHFKEFALWAKPGAPFVCLEPWLGYSDTDGVLNDIKDKKSIQHVEHGHVFEVDYTITV